MRLAAGRRVGRLRQSLEGLSFDGLIVGVVGVGRGEDLADGSRPVTRLAGLMLLLLNLPTQLLLHGFGGEGPVGRKAARRRVAEEGGRLTARWQRSTRAGPGAVAARRWGVAPFVVSRSARGRVAAGRRGGCGRTRRAGRSRRAPRGRAGSSRRPPGATTRRSGRAREAAASRPRRQRAPRRAARRARPRYRRTRRSWSARPRRARPRVGPTRSVGNAP
mmetsp:Transcript_13196/g.41768  ORF Transcript_13196/g.41768 Transcript_13196/m.41768 type:complete len:219 (+) Transcript_13196:741-1397(+)